MGKFQFVVLASRRAVQLTRGCTPRVTGGHKRTTIAQLEVAQGKVVEDLTPVVPPVVV
ncbi:MAG TPA: DNA-directed RNA polymerase subunit omega [Gemmatimonadaceae bacterium]|nr:DNA-directed RNA polymerase subunit omega [Gemmatimonadaceae bacterium]